MQQAKRCRILNGLEKCVRNLKLCKTSTWGASTWDDERVWYSEGVMVNKEVPSVLKTQAIHIPDYVNRRPYEARWNSLAGRMSLIPRDCSLKRISLSHENGIGISIQSSIPIGVDICDTNRVPRIHDALVKRSRISSPFKDPLNSIQTSVCWSCKESLAKAVGLNRLYSEEDMYSDNIHNVLTSSNGIANITLSGRARADARCRTAYLAADYVDQYIITVLMLNNAEVG